MKSWDGGLVFVAVLTLVVVSAVYALYAYLLVHGKPQGADDIIVGRILGTADMSLGMALAYWLGTSNSSRKKDVTISQLSAGVTPVVPDTGK